MLHHHHPIKKTKTTRTPKKPDRLTKLSKMVIKLADLLNKIIIDLAVLIFLGIAVWQIVKSKIDGM